MRWRRNERLEKIAKQLADNQSKNKQSDRIEAAKKHVKDIAKRCGEDIIVGRAYEHGDQSGTDWILKGYYAMTSEFGGGKIPNYYFALKMDAESNPLELKLEGKIRWSK